MFDTNPLPIVTGTPEDIFKHQSLLVTTDILVLRHLYVYLVKLSYMKQVDKKVSNKSNLKQKERELIKKVWNKKRASLHPPVTEQAGTIGTEVKDITRWLSGSKKVKGTELSDFDIIRLSETGITKEAIEALSQHMGISKKNMAEEILNISVKTLERKAPKEKMDKRLSSHALEIAKIMQHAFEIFEKEEKAKLWLNRENSALNGAKPVQLLNTLTGINLVNDILIRIEEGVYS